MSGIDDGELRLGMELLAISAEDLLALRSIEQLALFKRKVKARWHTIAKETHPDRGGTTTENFIAAQRLNEYVQQMELDVPKKRLTFRVKITF